VRTIFIVDDSDTNLSAAESVLEAQYRVMTVPSAEAMFKLLEKIRPELILLDIEMPKMNGLEALQRLKANYLYADIPVIFLTAMTDDAVEAYGFELGAIDFITKPFSAPVLLNRIKTHLNINTLIHEKTTQLLKLQNGVVSVLADMIENRDQVTGHHIERTTTYIKILIDAMMERGLYVNEMRTWDMDVAVASARLHDIGKIAVSDTILNKPDKLTREEYEAIKVHTKEGERIIDQIVAQAGEEAFLHHAKLFAGYHHEHWDGLGYPHKLKEGNIPLQGRLMAIVDVYDALVSERPYKHAFTEAEAERIIMAEAGRHFDPFIAAIFFEVKGRFREV
jgi:putative two-component system response regulator